MCLNGNSFSKQFYLLLSYFKTNSYIPISSLHISQVKIFTLFSISLHFSKYLLKFMFVSLNTPQDNICIYLLIFTMEPILLLYMCRATTLYSPTQHLDTSTLYQGNAVEGILKLMSFMNWKLTLTFLLTPLNSTSKMPWCTLSIIKFIVIWAQNPSHFFLFSFVSPIQSAIKNDWIFICKINQRQMSPFSKLFPC